MPLQNRVDPFGHIHAVPDRGTMMGNRGILHDDHRNLLKPTQHRNWVTCVLEFKSRQRTLMRPGYYTELFFLDEATAFAAGHRPCACCQRQRYDQFKSIWQKVHAHPAPDVGGFSSEVDKILHKSRYQRGGKKVTYSARLGDLPDGTMFSLDEQARIIWNGALFSWDFSGYSPHQSSLKSVAHRHVEVLTPEPIVAVFSAGLTPEVHQTLGRR